MRAYVANTMLKMAWEMKKLSSFELQGSGILSFKLSSNFILKLHGDLPETTENQFKHS